jgi:putative nucleotidyltransferase with HDIG domain
LIEIELAHDVARGLLATALPARWLHVQAVAEQATRFQRAYPEPTANLLIAAAYLHDIGYAPLIQETGFHPIDGALHLRRQGFDERVVGLVAHHSCACIEARFHGLAARLARDFPRDDSLPHDALLFCDLTIGPTGQPLSLDERLIDIRHRYGPEHRVTQFVNRAEPEFRASVGRAELLLASSLLPA